MNFQLDPYLESPKTFHLEMPLYHNLDLSIGGISEKVFKHLIYSGIIDAYCIWCGKESVFDTIEYLHLSKYSESFIYEKLSSWQKGENGFLRITHRCSREPNHRYFVYYFKEGNLFLKIGQYPSTADFQIPQAEKYRKMLGEKKYKELTKGIGLAAHGIGIGSFVYLRRVFENLIEEAYAKAQSDNKEFLNEKYI